MFALVGRIVAREPRIDCRNIIEHTSPQRGPRRDRRDGSISDKRTAWSAPLVPPLVAFPSLPPPFLSPEASSQASRDPD